MSHHWCAAVLPSSPWDRNKKHCLPCHFFLSFERNAQINKKSSAWRRKCKTLQNDRSLRKKTFSWKRFAEYKISCCFHWPSLYQLSYCTNFVASLYSTHRLYIKDSCCEVTLYLLYLYFNRNHNVQQTKCCTRNGWKLAVEPFFQHKTTVSRGHAHCKQKDTADQKDKTIF